jgi:WD40 repeat protein
LIAACADAKIYLLSVTRGYQSVAVLRGHTEPVSTIEFDESEEHLVSAGCYGELHVWGLQSDNPTEPIATSDASYLLSVILHSRRTSPFFFTFHLFSLHFALFALFCFILLSFIFALLWLFTC